MGNGHIFYDAVINTEQWGAGGMLVTWGEYGKEPTQPYPLYMTSVQIQYQRQQDNHWPVNVDPTGGNGMKRIIINGMPNGSLTCTSILGPTDPEGSGGVLKFLERAGQPCGDPISIQLQPFATSCTDQSKVVPVMYNLKDVILASLVDSVQTQQNGLFLVTGQLTFSFTELTISGGSSSAATNNGVNSPSGEHLNQNNPARRLVT